MISLFRNVNSLLFRASVICDFMMFVQKQLTKWNSVGWTFISLELQNWSFKPIQFWILSEGYSKKLILTTHGFLRFFFGNTNVLLYRIQCSGTSFSNCPDNYLLKKWVTNREILKGKKFGWKLTFSRKHGFWDILIFAILMTSQSSSIWSITQMNLLTSKIPQLRLQ